MSADASNQCFTVDSHSFEREVLNQPGAVLVDFCAEWCVPCQLLAPVLEKIAGSFAGRLRVARLNVDENAELADAFRISSIPALKLIRGGRLIGEWTGYHTGDCLAADIEKLLSETEIAV